MRILVVEDDAEMRSFLCKELFASGYEIMEAEDGRQGLMLTATNDFSVLIVDRMLPKLDGVGMVTALRSMDIQTPVIFLTALGRVDERVQGLRSGADDYVVKPFATVELTARIEALARRTRLKPAKHLLRVRDLELNLLDHTATRGDRKIQLKPREFRLLEYLMKNSGKVVTRTMLLESVWDFHFDPQTTLVESHISRIRAKVDNGFACALIQTVCGAGYRMADESVS